MVIISSWLLSLTESRCGGACDLPVQNNPSRVLMMCEQVAVYIDFERGAGQGFILIESTEEMNQWKKNPAEEWPPIESNNKGYSK